MSFDVARALRKSTGRAKSDVANKLVSMLLHELSRKACQSGGMFVSDSRYALAVIESFGENCLYCGKTLEQDRSAVEHLNGMNRFQVGLHVPGNVAMACKRCNNEKRRDDQLPLLSDRENGWESFLSHDGTRCLTDCKVCDYWSEIWPDCEARKALLAAAKERVVRFQSPFSHFIIWSGEARDTIRQKVEILYRDCQSFATSELEKLTSEIESEVLKLEDVG